MAGRTAKLDSGEPKPKKVRTYHVTTYGIGSGEVDGEGAAIEIMRDRNRLWNKLVEVERAYEATREAEIAAVAPDWAESVAGLPAEDDRTAEAKAYRKTHRELRKDVLARPEVREVIDRLTTGRTQAVKDAYHDSGLYWGNYLEVITDYDRARRRPGDLRFHRWDPGTGKVSVHYQDGVPMPLVMQGDTRFQIDPIPEEAWSSPSRSVRRKLARTTARIRIGSKTKSGREPIWLTLPIVMHRALPHGLVRHVSAVRERVGLDFRWRIVVTVELPDDRPIPTPKGAGRISIDVGWRKLPHDWPLVDPAPAWQSHQRSDREVESDLDLARLRVAVWADSYGNRGEVALSGWWVRAMEKTRDIQSIRDLMFNTVRGEVSGWLRRMRNEGRELPEWLTNDTTTISNWKSPGRMWHLAGHWQRFEGDEEVWRVLHGDPAGPCPLHPEAKHDHLHEAIICGECGAVLGRDGWVEREHHLYSYQAHLRDQMLADRRETYRQFAAWVARSYDEVVVESIDVKKLAEAENALAGGARTEAAVGSFLLIVKNAANREGVRVVEADPANTTSRCNVCGVIDDFDHVKQIEHTCGACGVTWDQDFNAALNLLLMEDAPVGEPEAVLV